MTPLKPPASFSVWGVWRGTGQLSFWATRRLAEQERAIKAAKMSDIEVIEHQVWQDAEAYRKENR